MRTLLHKRKRHVGHADDWLMTYADMITLLLCFFALFLCVTLSKKDAKQQLETPTASANVDLPLLPALADFHPLTEEDLHPEKPRIEAPTSDVVSLETSAPGDAPTAQPNGQAAIVTTETPQVPVTAPPVPSPLPAQAVQASEPSLDPTPAPAPPATEPKGDRITMMEMSSEAVFGRGSAVLSEQGRKVLRDIAAKIRSPHFRDYQVTVEGHTDDVPIKTAQFPSNWELSTARASAVVHFFLDEGIAAQRLRAAGYADSFPKAPNRAADGTPLPINQAANRRVVIKLEKIDHGD